MTPKAHAVVLDTDPPDLSEQARRIQAELARALGAGSLAAECVPPLDIFETDHTIEVVLDLPGVQASDVRIVVKGSVLLIAGIKAPRRQRGEASFHLLERGYGRFARSVQFNKPCDPSRATARISRGEVRVTVPRLSERRGKMFDIPLFADSPTA